MTPALHSVVMGHQTVEKPDGNRKRIDKLRTLPAHSHFLTVAAAGSGKGTAVLAPNLLGGWKGSTFVFDPKGELTWWAAAYRARPVAEGGLGQRVVIIDPFDQVNERFRDRLPPALRDQHQPIKSTSWNPLDGVDESDEKNFIDALSNLSEGLIKQSSRESHWDDSAKMLIRGVAAAVCERLPRPSMRDVRALLSRPHAEWTNELLGTYDKETGLRAADAKLDRDRFAWNTLTRFGERTPEVASVVNNAITQLSFLEHPRMLKSFETPARPADRFTFADLARSDMTVFLVLPPAKFNDVYGRWLRLLLQRALSEVMSANNPTHKVLFLLDEFGTVGALPAVENAFGLARGLGVSLWPFVQDINQLQRDYPKSWRTFIANCTGELYFGINDYATAEHVSQSTDEVVRWNRSLQAGGTGSMSQTEQRERALRPFEIMQATQGRLHEDGRREEANWLLRTRAHYEWIGPAHYHAVPEWKGRARPDPDHLAK